MIAGVSAAVMFAVGLDNAWFWTILLFLLCFIPMIGVTVGSIVPALFALLQFASWWQAAVIFGAIQVVAFIVGNFIYPRLQAETQNINPIATLLALSFWGSLWGLTGAFLAVPLTLMVMMAFAYFERTRWIAVLLSDDGKPSLPKRLTEARQPKKGARPPSQGSLPMCDSDNHQGFIADTSVTRRSVVSSALAQARHIPRWARNRLDADRLFPRKAGLTIYLHDPMDFYDELFSKLGKHSTSKACLYIKRLSDVDRKVLKELIAASLKRTNE